MMFAVFGMPGHIELLIIGTICFLMLVPLITAVIIVLVVNRKRSANNPNLAPCPDCGRAVSPSAVSCPGCGCPLSEEK